MAMAPGFRGHQRSGNPPALTEADAALTASSSLFFFISFLFSGVPGKKVDQTLTGVSETILAGPPRPNRRRKGRPLYVPRDDHWTRGPSGTPAHARTQLESDPHGFPHRLPAPLPLAASNFANELAYAEWP